MQPDTFNGRWFGMEISDREVFRMTQAAEQFAKGCIGNRKDAPKTFVLSGKNGTGKTKILRGMHRYFDAARITCYEMGLWAKAPPQVDFVEWVRVAQVDPFEDERYFEELCQPDILLLDDIGAETDPFKSATANSNLALLLGRREPKWTALTTNILPEDWVARWGKRVTERLHRHSTIVTIRKATSWSLARAKTGDSKGD